ncbi:PREDICTED: uncharacterized protein C5orf34 homolog [Miniopterus natalensis]|uniref:uncharacterized protein C5orf34 homolog n=1 Tax=Miniopterus natalensis TaxID=291302 RepID=UPI0007A729F3|nr:PREDICTED: uncharacterized protein C5orf34 homolog [Miniopterus natalensis]XP_016054163.1 PREDICTED: uncharacterized protein C5orf34 homolog [Miniopterus natalensis]
MTAPEVRMVLYEDDSVQVHYVDGSRLQLSPCGSEFLFEKAPPVSAHPLEQPERIRQRTHFVISTYREQLQRALDFRNCFATCPFLSESIIPSERKKRILIDVSEVRWPSLETDDGIMVMQSGTVKIASLDGHAYLCLPKSQQEFSVHFLCKVSQKPDSSIVLSEKNSQAKKEQLVEKAGKTLTYRSLQEQRLKNKENELRCQIVKSRAPSEKHCASGTEGQEVLPSPGTKHSCVHVWVEQRWSVASCPEEWKHPLSLALRFHNKISSMSGTDVNITQNTMLTSAVSEETGKEVSVLPRALLLSCPVPHLHRWDFCDSLSQGPSEGEYSSPELVKVVWYKGVTYRLTHKNVNSIEIYPGDGSVFKSEGAYFGNYFTYYSIQEGSGEREEKMYSVNNLPPDTPGSPFSVSFLIKQATRILQHCAKMRLSLSHNYRICCWKMVPGINDNMLPLLLRESFIPSVGRFLAYSDDKVHVIFIDGVTLTLNWNFGSFTEKRQVNQGLSLGWCKITFPDGHDQLIQIEHSGPYERYVSTVISWCRRLTQASQREMPTHLSSSVLEENWCVAAELEKIQKFNLLLESSGVLNQISNKQNEQSSDCKPNYSGTLPEEVNEKRVSVALKKTSEIIQDIDCLLSNSKR